jgi:hypothetical protein
MEILEVMRQEGYSGSSLWIIVVLLIIIVKRWRQGGNGVINAPRINITVILIIIPKSRTTTITLPDLTLDSRLPESSQFIRALGSGEQTDLNSLRSEYIRATSYKPRF